MRALVTDALDILRSEPERVKTLWELTHYTLDQFRSRGFEIGPTSTPIIPLYIRSDEKTFMITKELFEKGVFVNPVVSPAVSPEETLIRFSLMATHTYEQIDRAIDEIDTLFRKYGVI